MGPSRGVAAEVVQSFGKSTRDRGILFSAPMVQAILAGGKTQTRRPALRASEYPMVPARCPYGRIGDLLWVRETWGLLDTEPSDGPERAHVFYRATDGKRPELRYQLWRPSIFMPRWASRLTLRIVDVRAQRLQEISEADARAEGVRPSAALTVVDNHGSWHPELANTHRGALACLWDSLNAKRAPWGANPPVWAITFELVSDQSDAR